MFAQLVIATLLIVPGILMAEAPPSVQIRSEVSPKEIYIGDIIEYRITAVYSAGVSPSTLETSKQLGEFEVLNSATSQPKPAQDNKFEIQHQLTLTTFSTGTQTIPALSLAFSTNGQIAEAKTQDVAVTVKSLLEEKGDLGQLMPLKGFFDFKSWLWLWILLAALVIVVASVFVVRLLRRNKGSSAGTQKLALPPEETAWQALYDLENSDLLSQGLTKEYYFRLSVIFRHYLENRYGISALERTTSELLLEFRRLNLPLSLTNLSRDFLDYADLVKFAKYTPSEEDIGKDLNRVKEFLSLTTPVKPETTAAARKEAIPV